ncbi:MAG: hypothetical protein AAB864_01890 [Patescibacteria group bacterium]
MKRVMFVALLVLVVSSPLMADNVELQVINGQPNLDLFLTGQIKGKFGWSAFGLLNENWGQIYAGPSFSPAKWCTLYVSTGLEFGGRRFSESVWLGRGPVSVLAIYEHGHTGAWHKILAVVTVAKGVTVGYHDQAFVGRGARASYTRGKVSVWASALVKNGELNNILGFSVNK